MDLEQQLRSTYAERLGELDLPGGDVATARGTGARMRARRRLAVGAAAVVGFAVAAGGTLLGTGRVSVGPSDGPGHWREVPAAPLSPRTEALAVWTGHEVVVIGGDQNPCPPSADCAAPKHLLRNGAAYDPVAGAWHPIADAPVGVGPGDRLVVADGRVVLRHWRQHGYGWFVYDPLKDTWSDDLGGPPGLRDGLSALGRDVYGTVGRHVVSYDVVRGVWRNLPPDPIEPRLAQQQVTATDVGPVLTGYDATKPNDGRSPSVVLADVFDGTSWHRLPPTGQVDNTWTWTGSRMVDPDPTVVTGGETNPYPRPYPSGGLLDPATGAWTRLPHATLAGWDGWGIYAAGPRWFAAYGHVYDSRTDDVARLPQPHGAPDQGVAVAWTDTQLLAVGGATFDTAPTRLSNRAWLWTP